MQLAIRPRHAALYMQYRELKHFTPLCSGESGSRCLKEMGVHDHSRFPLRGMQGASSPVLWEVGQLPPCLPEPAHRLSFDLVFLVWQKGKYRILSSGS